MKLFNEGHRMFSERLGARGISKTEHETFLAAINLKFEPLKA